MQILNNSLSSWSYPKIMKRKSILFLLSIAVSLVFFSCQKNEEYVAVPYACDCGEYSWRGSSYKLLDANYILVHPDSSLSRRYYITADVKADTDPQPHGVNLIIEIENVEESIFDITETLNEFSAIAQEVNQNDFLIPLREYVAVSGRIQVIPAFFGGTETVRFSIVLRESIEGDLVGPEFSFTGEFTVNVTP